MPHAGRPAAVTLRRPIALALAVALAAGGWGTHRAARAAEPDASAAAAFLAEKQGGRADDYELVYERRARAGSPAESLWAGKLVNRSTGRVQVVYRDEAGRLGGPELLADRLRTAQGAASAFERKASAGLRRAVAERLQRRPAAPAGERLPVAVWLDVDVEAAERAVIGRHSELSWAGNRPLTGDLQLLRRLRAELWAARRDAYATAARELRTAVERADGELAYASTSAPLAFLDLPAAAVEALAARPDVSSLGLEGRWEPAMSAAGPAVEANWTSGSGDRGAGIRVGVVEYHNVRNGGDLSGKVVRSHSTSGTLRYSPTFDHPTWVAGAVAGQASSYSGVAPGAAIVSSGTGGYSPSLAYDRYIIAAADWAVSPSGGDADIVNTSLAQDTATGAEEARRYFDSIVDRGARLAVSAAGNYVNFNAWHIASPGTGYNVLTVGGVDDRGSAGRSDDRIWYVPGSNGSNWFDRPSDSWNAHGDYNKPNLVAPAVGVRTANGLAASGTSVATPIAAGVAAQVLANEPILAAWPEGARAVLMAGAIHRVPMPDGSRNVDHEGVGMVSALWSNRAAVAGDNELGGYRLGSLGVGDEPVQQVSVRGGDRLRVALAWNSHTSGSGDLRLTDTLRADLDLRVTDPAGRVVGSYTFDNAYEFVEVVMPTSGVARLQVLQSRFDGASETYGLAWAKVRDTVRPSVTLKVPQPGEPWAVPSGELRVSFSEPVSGVSDRSFRLRRVSTGDLVDATVTYQSTARTALLRAAGRLKPGRYRAVLRTSITDAAGNALPYTAWYFSVKRPAAPISKTFRSARRISFSAGTHVGYRFDAGGAVTASRSYRLSSASGALVDRRATVPGNPGIWLRVVNGVWAGYWVRESGAAGLNGRVGSRTWEDGKRIVVRAGTHVGRKFDSAGRATASKAYTLGRTSGASVSRRAVINGAWQVKVADGIWAGYWLPESASVYVRGMLTLTDLDAARARMSSGTRTAYRYRASGAMRSSRTLTLSSASGAPVAAWGTVNGRPSLYVTAGGWAGYWLPETAGVWVP